MHLETLERLMTGVFPALLACPVIVGCGGTEAWQDDQDSTTETDPPPDTSHDTPLDTEHDTALDTLIDTWDVTDTAVDTMPPDTLDPGYDTAPDTSDPSPACGGVLHAGCCWYLSGNAYASESCTTICSTHGGYDDCTRTYAGSDGSLENCDALLTALGAAGPGTTQPLLGYFAGIGCNVMYTENDRLWVPDPATTESATGAMARRACACLE